jgi:PAS domain-containing protein
MGADNWLQESRLDSRFAPLLQLGSLAILDFTGLILAANQSFCEMLGYPSGDLVGRKVLEVTYPEDRDLGRELMRQAMAGARSRTIVWRSAICAGTAAISGRNCRAPSSAIRRPASRNISPR